MKRSVHERTRRSSWDRPSGGPRFAAGFRCCRAHPATSRLPHFFMKFRGPQASATDDKNRSSVPLSPRSLVAVPPLCITPLQILRSPRGAGFQARNADILVGASGRAPILVAAPLLCGAANPGCRRLSAGAVGSRVANPPQVANLPHQPALFVNVSCAPLYSPPACWRWWRSARRRRTSCGFHRPTASWNYAC